MTKASVVMENFMKKLVNNEYPKENQPNDGPVISEEFIEEQLQSYSRLLDSGIVEAATR